MTKNRTSSIRLTEEQYLFLKENNLSLSSLVDEIIEYYQGKNLEFWNQKLKNVNTIVNTIENKIKEIETINSKKTIENEQNNLKSIIAEVKNHEFGYNRYKFFYLLAKIQEAYSDYNIINRLERVLYFLHIGVSIGIASLVSSIILSSALIISYFFNGKLPLGLCFVETRYESCSYLVVLIIMCFICYFCWRESIWKMDEYINFFHEMDESRIG